MVNQTVELQAKIYVYDLNNCANEYGFKDDEGWELSLANDAEKSEIEKNIIRPSLPGSYPRFYPNCSILSK